MDKQNPRRTKIVATLGPVTDDPVMLEKILRAGVDAVRLNFSHGKLIDHQRRADEVRRLSSKLHREVAIIADLQGPKIRIARFTQGKITLKTAQSFILDTACPDDLGSDEVVGIDYKNLPRDVHIGDKLLLDDGLIILRVEKIQDTQIQCIVLEGGELSNNKGINREGGGLSANALTDKDKADLLFAVKLDVDYFAISFVKNSDDVHEARALLTAAGSSAGIISKIERIEALAHLDAIIEASDAVMVARGDLGVEIGDEQIPSAQKRIIQRARALDKTVITATQMMESMIYHPIPTRAEVCDVANAVLDGTDAVMLSAETATGAYADKAVAAMARICLGAEQDRVMQRPVSYEEEHVNRINKVIAMAAMHIANSIDIKAIIALTESGLTPLLTSRIRSGIPLYALCRHANVRRKMMLYRGVYPLAYDISHLGAEVVDESILAELKRLTILVENDSVVLTKGDQLNTIGGTNTLKIITLH